MGRITGIEVQKRDHNRVSIQIDGAFAFGLSRSLIAGLQVGQELSEDDILALRARDDRERAYRQALLFLSFRARSEAEIRRNLQKHEISEAIIEETIARLKQERFAGDADFARTWVENRSAFRPRSRRALVFELQRKGLDEENIQAAVGEVDEERLAYSAAAQRAARYEGLAWEEFRAKLSSFLARRGFSYDLIGTVVRQLWDESHSTNHSTGM